MKEPIYNLDKNKVGEVDLAEDVFGVPVNKVLLYDVLKMQMASKRGGNAASKNRALVSGSTKKIYRQKGTGRARHSDRRANIFVGGGKSFGPHPRDYLYSVPLKARRGAMRSALASKHNEGKLLVVDKLTPTQPKTKLVVGYLKSLGVRKALIVIDSADEVLRRAVGNIANVKLVRLDGMNLCDVVGHEHLVITPPALARLQEMLKP